MALLNFFLSHHKLNERRTESPRMAENETETTTGDVRGAAMLSLSMRRSHHQENTGTGNGQSVVVRLDALQQNAQLWSQTFTMKVVSRQSRWQARRRASGLCYICGSEPAIDGWHCNGCREKGRASRRNYYRKKVGIPLNAPISKCGRPRVS